MRTDWTRLRAVVLESDDWGLCAWSADEAAWRSLADTPAFRSAPGRVYGRSTLESAADVQALCETLLAFRGADGAPPVWQANTIVAAPDFERLAREGWSHADLPLLEPPRAAVALGATGPVGAGGRRDRRRRLVARAARAHAPARAGLARARWPAATPTRVSAFAQQCLVCEAVEASGEYDPHRAARGARRATSSAPARSSRGASAARRSPSARPTTAGTARSRPTSPGWTCASCRA